MGALLGVVSNVLALGESLGVWGILSTVRFGENRQRNMRQPSDPPNDNTPNALCRHIRWAMPLKLGPDTHQGVA